MGNITKKQHYVWRKYLAAWTDDPCNTKGAIAVLNKSNGTLKLRGLGNVAYENYMYDASMMTEADKKLISAYARKMYSEILHFDVDVSVTYNEKLTERDFFEHEYVGRLENNGQKFLDRLWRGELPYDGLSERDKIVVRLRDRLIAVLLGGTPPTDEELAAMTKEFDAAEDTDERFEFFEFLMQQMFRTRYGKQSVIDALEKTKERFGDELLEGATEAVFPFMMGINAVYMAIVLEKANFGVELIKNKTDVAFITSDFPVINLCAAYGEAKVGEPTEMEWYYPVTPEIAVVCKKAMRNNSTRVVSEAAEIAEYNNKIASAAAEFVFAHVTEELKSYL